MKGRTNRCLRVSRSVSTAASVRLISVCSQLVQSSFVVPVSRTVSYLHHMQSEVRGGREDERGHPLCVSKQDLGSISLDAAANNSAGVLADRALQMKDASNYRNHSLNF